MASSTRTAMPSGSASQGKSASRMASRSALHAAAFARAWAARSGAMATTSPEASSKRPSCSMTQGMNSSALMRSGRGRVIGASGVISDIARPACTVPRGERASDPSTWPPTPTA